MVSEAIKAGLYRSGLLGLVHRLRNRRTLTVIMFHRVLTPEDPRWSTCDPDYTLSAALFSQCLAFFRAHYHIVSPEQVLQARRGGKRLPPRALLITFDDGWADNVAHALPLLRAGSVPGLMFVAADAVGRQAPFFQELLVGAWRSGRLTCAMLARALGQAPEADNAERRLRRLIAEVEALDPAARQRLMAGLGDGLHDGLRHMVTPPELRQLHDGGVAIGLHGKTHLPFTRVDDLDAEISGARQAVAAWLPGLPPPATMSFPHGRFNDAIARQAHEAGFELVFTSVPGVNRTSGALAWLMARVGFEQAAIVDSAGRFSAAKLAMYLFFRRHEALAT